MTEVQQLAEFVTSRRYEDLSAEAVSALKIRLLDALGCAYGALHGEPIRLLREHVFEFGGAPLVSLIGGGKTSPDRAAFYNSANTAQSGQGNGVTSTFTGQWNLSAAGVLTYTVPSGTPLPAPLLLLLSGLGMTGLVARRKTGVVETTDASAA